MPEALDLIGDVHGMRRSLEAMLAELGHVRESGHWHHPEGRRVIFLGDLVDRGPDPLGCLEIAEEVVRQGHGSMILGNHELNLLHYLTDPPLRAHTRGRDHQVAITLAQIRERPGRWKPLEAFLRSLPLSLILDEGRLRAIHACWDDALVRKLPASLASDEDLRAVAEHGELAFEIEVCLKGPEAPCDPFEDRNGIMRHMERVAWWRDYPADAPFVAFGHYWFPWRTEARVTPDEPSVMGPGANTACLDWCAGRGGPLVAMRWPERAFVSVANVDLGD